MALPLAPSLLRHASSSLRTQCPRCLRSFSASTRTSTHRRALMTESRAPARTPPPPDRFARYTLPQTLGSKPKPLDAPTAPGMSPAGMSQGAEGKAAGRTAAAAAADTATTSAAAASTAATTTTPAALPAADAAPKQRPRSKLRMRKAAMTLTPSAVEHLRELLDSPEPKLIRVGVKSKGCSGSAYHLEYVDTPARFDEQVEQDGVKVLIDSKALMKVLGSEMDWVEDKLNARFTFRNPNITEQCGCGESFSVS